MQFEIINAKDIHVGDNLIVVRNDRITADVITSIYSGKDSRIIVLENEPEGLNTAMAKHFQVIGTGLNGQRLLTAQ